MTASEVMGRALEKWRHQTERFARHEISGVILSGSAIDVPAMPSRDAAPALLKQALADDAAKLIAGQWSLFGWNEVQVASPPNWHRDYAKGVDVPMRNSINHRDLPHGADVRTIWEINRWAEIVRLGMHAYVNDDLQAIKTAQAWLMDWAEKNPVGEGINWTSALEGGLRLINFCWFDALVTKSQASAEQQATQRALVNAIVPAHVWWVTRYVSFGSSANNHRLGELTGLLLAAKRWPELERLAGTAETLWEQISECVLSQFAEDGGNHEQALHYHLFAMEMALHAARAMDVKEGPVIERMRKAAEFFTLTAHPQEPWDYGDNDDAQIVPLTMHREQAVAEWCAWMKGGGTGILPVAIGYWLKEDRQDACPIHRRNSYAASGMAVIKRDGWKVRLDASPLGFGMMAAHGHCDALHVSLWDGAHALVIDPGTGGYYGMKEQRAALAAWGAHNGPQPLSGFKTPQRMGTFLLSQHHAQPELQEVTDGFVQAHFQHEGHSFTRRVEVLQDGSASVEDHAENDALFCVRWHLAPECLVKAEAEQAYHIHRDEKAWRVLFNGHEITSTIHEGVASRRYGEFEKCAVIEVTARGHAVATWNRISL